MKEESIKLAKEIIVEALLEKSEKAKKIDEIDKLEICYNISMFLDNYAKDLKVLQENERKRR